MLNDFQVDKHQTGFIQFGKILFIYAFVYIVTQIISLFTDVLTFFIGFLTYIILNLIVTINVSVFLFLLIYNTQKIKKSMPNNSSLRTFYIGLLIWLILYIIISVILILPSFISISQQLGYNLTLTISILSIIISVFQLVAWNSLSSFFKISKNKEHPAIRNNSYTACKVLVVAAGVGIFTGIIKTFMVMLAQSADFLNTSNLEYFLVIMIIFISASSGSFIIFVVGYFMLSSNLKKSVLNWNQKELPYRNVPIREQRFCQYCGYHVEPFMQFCPECGKSLKS